MDVIQTLKPKGTKRILLFIAAFVWTFAGSMLLYKGFLMSYDVKNFLMIKVLLSVAGGVLFFIMMFAKLSLKHTRRIIELENDKPCLFSFFSLRSYILMAIMITSGILIRKSGVLSSEYLIIIYVTMGIPLFLSAIRFYYYGIFYQKMAGVV
ncbi:MAG: hypothetical protein JXA53_10550 [Bacteroidales bacterium]|nr:hypothetical protein [Bacteroidales bacterium]